MDRQASNTDWEVRGADGTITWERAGIAVMMDVRRELQKLNRLLGCSNFTGIPATLRGIRENTRKPRKQKKRAGA